jgi:hypothetical protein
MVLNRCNLSTAARRLYGNSAGARAPVFLWAAAKGKRMTRSIFLYVAALILPAGVAQAQDVSAEIDLLEMHVGSGDDHFVFDG